MAFDFHLYTALYLEILPKQNLNISVKAEQETVQIKLKGAKFLLKKKLWCATSWGGGEGKKYITRYFN